MFCENVPTGISAGPLEIDLDNHVVYRYAQREPWHITGLHNQFVTFEKLMGTGGEIAVLDTTTGVLESAGVSLWCDHKVGPCTEKLAHLWNIPKSDVKCAKSLPSE